MSENIIEANAMRSKITLLLDENLSSLKPGLRDAGLKVISFDSKTPDDTLIELAEGLAILTNNSKDFLNDAVAGDYDVISTENIKFIDTLTTRKNSTVQKIVKAIRESGLYTRKGNFHLSINDDGSFVLKQLTV
jgi:hypothetical protein